MNIEEAKELFKKRIELEEYSGMTTNTLKEAMTTVLSELERVHKEKELHIKLEQQYKKEYLDLKAELETSKKETQEILNDYQDLGKELHKLECEAEKKDKVINEMAKWMAGGNSYMYATAEDVKREFYNQVEREGK